MSLFHKCFYHFVKFLVRPFLFLNHYSWKRYKPKAKNYLVLSNHVTNWDFFLVGMCLGKQMYFVASEHILRKNFSGRLIKFLVDPIPRKKGASGSEAAGAIIERLHQGKNVCMAVEGSRCFNGVTGSISPANAKLVKDSNAALITCAIHGGYLINPRWSNEKRKGPYWGEIVHEYSPEELKKMSDDELNQLIYNDIRVDAFEDQRIVKAEYRCKNRAKNLERALYLCPECHEFSTLRSEKDRFFCSNCNLDLTFNKYGFFEGNGGTEPKFDNILEWDKWQVGFLPEKLSEFTDPDKVIFEDDNQSLFEVRDGVKKLLGKGRMAVFCNRLEIASESFGMEDISKMSLSMSDNILFTTSSGRYLEIRTDYPRSSVRYLMAVRYFQGKELIIR